MDAAADDLEAALRSVSASETLVESLPGKKPGTSTTLTPEFVAAACPLSSPSLSGNTRLAAIATSTPKPARLRPSLPCGCLINFPHACTRCTNE